jgi:hypothetical protein
MADLTGHEDHNIGLQAAANMTRRYRESIEKGNKIAGYFGEDAIEAILAQDGCIGIRYYYGINDEGQKVLILVGVKANADDIYEGRIMEMSWPCPHCCSTANPLNS